MPQGLVIKSTGNNYKVKINSSIYDCTLAGKYRLEGKKSTNPVAVGDLVEVDENFQVILNVADRRNYIIRRATNLSKKTHVIAANLDCVVIVASIASPRTSTGFIDRVLVTAEAYGIDAIIVFNKIDLLNQSELEYLDELCDDYDILGYKSFKISALKNTGMDDFTHNLNKKTALFIGHSGAGKSSILNCIDPSIAQKTGEISQKHQKGTHTTTFAELHETQTGIRIIDTPGVKEFGLVHMNKVEISDYFPELRMLRKSCKFQDCLHVNEPSCAVIQSVEAGEMPAWRYKNYLNILESNDFVYWDD